LQEAGTIPLTLYNVGLPGAYPVARTAPFLWRLTVISDSPAARAGLRNGDIVDAQTMTSVERFRLWSQAPVSGQPQPFPVLRNGHLRRFVVTPSPYPFDWALCIAIAAGFWSALCAVVLLIRRGEDRGVQVLVLYLLLVRLSIQMAPVNWVTAYPAADLVNAVFNAIMPAGWALLATYAVHFVASNRTTRVLAFLSYVLAAYIAATGALAALGSWFGSFDPLAALFVGFPDVAMQAAYALAPLICSVVALRSAGGIDRARMAWLLGPTAVIYFIYLAYLAANYVPIIASDAVTNVLLVLQLLAPLGITYAMLNRRLLDVGFALNRAAVFTGVSLIVFGTFQVVQWALNRTFGSAMQSQNLLISALLTFFLGMSLHVIRKRVEAVLDSVFFRKRRDDEAGLLRFAREAPYINDRATLLQRAREVLSRHADASSVTFALSDGTTTYGGVSGNDPAFVTLRASNNVVDLSAIATDLQGEFAYPMIARGRFLGAMAVGPKRSGESYAPDESHMIAALAHAVATSVDVLSLADHTYEDVLLAAILDLRRVVAILTERIDAVPVALEGDHTDR